MNYRAHTPRNLLAVFLVLAWCFGCGPAPGANIEDVAARFVPRLRLGMPLDSAAGMLAGVRRVESWGQVGTLAEARDFPRVGVRATDGGRGRVGEIHMFSPRREIVPGVVQAITSAARVAPRKRCAGGNGHIVVYVWRADGGRVLLTDNQAAAPGAAPVHLSFVSSQARRPLTYEMKRCPRA